MGNATAEAAYTFFCEQKLYVYVLSVLCCGKCLRIIMRTYTFT